MSSFPRRFIAFPLLAFLAGCSNKEGPVDPPVQPPSPVIVSVLNRLFVDIRVGTVANQNIDVPAGSPAVSIEFPAGTTQIRWVSKGKTFSDGSRIPDDLVGATVPVASMVDITATVAGVRYFQPRISQLFAVDTLSFNLKSSASNRCIGSQWGGTTGISWGYYALQADSELEVFGGSGCAAARYLGKWSNAQLAGANDITGERILSGGSAFPLKAVTISPTSPSVLINSTATLSATQVDQLNRSLGNYFPLAWSSSDTTVASVTNAGVVSGKKVGVSSIKASVGTIEGVASLTVREPTPTSVRICLSTDILICTTSLFLNAGLSTSLVASAFDGTTNITSQCSFTWLSSNEALATVTPNPDTRSAIALRKSTSSGVTITATCKGVSGVFNLI